MGFFIPIIPRERTTHIRGVVRSLAFFSSMHGSLDPAPSPYVRRVGGGGRFAARRLHGAFGAMQ